MKTMLFSLLLILSLSACEKVAFEGARRALNQTDIAVTRLKAENGDVEAQYRAGKMLCCGRPSGHDMEEALQWFCLAAKRGQRDAMFEVGNMHAGVYHQTGGPIPLNRVLAFTYYQLASQNGNQQAHIYTETLLPNMSDEEISQAEKFIALWPAIPCDVTL